MKRILALLLAAILCLSLVACGGTTAGSGASTGNDPVASYVVHVEVNPEIELHCDNEGNILSLVCLNADAEKATQGISVTGKTLDAGLTELLLAFHQAGYIKKDSNKVSVTINCYTSPDDSICYAMCDTAMQNFSAETNIGLQCSVESNIYATVEPPADGQLQNGQQQDSNTTETTDADGNRVVTVRDNGGKLQREMVYSPSGKLIRQMDYMSDGMVETTEYHENGKISMQRQVMPDGSETQNTFDDQGQPLFTRVRQTDGTWQTTENQYHANGVVSMIRITTEDMTTAEYFNEDGVLTERLEETNTIDQKLYNAAGVVTYHQRIDEVGNPMEEWFSDTGIVKERKYQDDTGRHEELYYENGVMAEHIIRNGGSEASDETIYQYDSAGNCTLHQSIRINSDGFRTETTYNPDGSRYAYEYHTDGTVWYCEFTADGVQLLDTLKQIQ